MVNKVTNCTVMQDANVTEFPYLTVFIYIRQSMHFALTSLLIFLGSV